MCGLAGFVGVAEKHRLALAYTLALAIDKRGGHGAGYVAANGKVSYGRKEGHFSGASFGFLSSAASGDSTILHARYATCAGKTSEEAHPFAIKRDGKTVLYGAHNGIIDNARASAVRHGRPYDVDSRELFHLLADGAYEAIGALEGYGTLAWVMAADPKTVRLVQMTEDGDLEVALCKEGGFVFGSTRAIVEAGIDAAGLTLRHFYKIPLGEVFTLHPDRGIEGTPEKIALAPRHTMRLWDSSFLLDDVDTGDPDQAAELAAEFLEDGWSVQDLRDEQFSEEEIDAAGKILLKRYEDAAVEDDVDDFKSYMDRQH